MFNLHILLKAEAIKLACKDPNKNKLACAELGIATTN